LNQLHFPAVVTSTIFLITSDAVMPPFQISISDRHSPPEFGRLQQLQASKGIVDFQPLRRGRFDFSVPIQLSIAFVKIDFEF
jgi:hypothetical protein